MEKFQWLLLILASVANGGCGDSKNPPAGYVTVDELKAVETSLSTALNAQHRAEEDLASMETELGRLQHEMAKGSLQSDPVFDSGWSSEMGRPEIFLACRSIADPAAARDLWLQTVNGWLALQDVRPGAVMPSTQRNAVGGWATMIENNGEGKWRLSVLRDPSTPPVEAKRIAEPVDLLIDHRQGFPITVRGNIFDIHYGGAWFTACAKVGDDEDASNLFSFGEKFLENTYDGDDLSTSKAVMQYIVDVDVKDEVTTYTIREKVGR